ncbi:MAG TPA: ATP-dependent Clp protease adaptor ClpS [Saprospiraceae bacterium]|nr:ATP-dependent Clp protease adaptor ClpS [Saprospiraceae bacterium]
MVQNNPGTWEAIEEDVMVEDQLGSLAELIVYNDDINTFDWVIESLMDICRHSFEQAEQLSLIVHFKGKAIVKTDSFNILRPMKDALCDRGLSAVIESIKV